MYYATGLPGWLRFGFSPGWQGRSPSGLPPTAQWLLQSGQLPQYTQWLQKNVPTATTPQATGQPMPVVPSLPEEQEKGLLEQQVKLLESQLSALRKRLDELSK